MTLFLSDLHLGSKRCKAKELSAFLDTQNTDDLLILVGDLFDDLGMSYWPADHLEVVKKLLEFDQIIYAPGNHDHAARALCGLNSRKIKVHNEGIYEANDGRKFLVTHGDRYDWSMRLVVGPHWLRAALQWRADSWHSSSLLSTQIERKVVAEAKRIGVDGVICGHTHGPMQEKIDDIEYVNCGDWIRNCTAVIDDEDGMRLVYGGKRGEAAASIPANNRTAA